MNKLPLDGRSLEQRIEAAISLLKDNGYTVRGPFLKRDYIESMATKKQPLGLVRYFYDQMFKYNPDFRMGYSGNKKRDLAIAKDFIAFRQDTGISYIEAVRQCCELIDTLFKYESHLNLHRPITSMTVLSKSEGTAWIVERLLNICNGIDVEINDLENDRWFDNLHKEQEEKIDEEGLKQREDFLKEVLDKYAEEKTDNKE